MIKERCQKKNISQRGKCFFCVEISDRVFFLRNITKLVDVFPILMWASKHLEKMLGFFQKLTTVLV